MFRFCGRSKCPGVRHLAWLAIGVAACGRPEVALPGQDCTPIADAPTSAARYLLYTHAHNDYAHEHPLFDALAVQFYSVEADIWLVNGDIVVGHSRDALKGRLQTLYLDPLQERVSAQGSVHGDGIVFSLWICIKDSNPALRPALHDLLERYPMLTEFTDTAVTEGAVTAILTGDATQKESFVAEYSPRKACRDSNDFSPSDSPADHSWLYYALDWSVYVDGDDERQNCIVRNAHRFGRQVRFWNAPDQPSYWRSAVQSGVDFINTDRPQELHDFLAGLP
jgi:hypothetical protein